MKKGKRNAMLLVLNTEEMVNKPKNVGGLQQLEKRREGVFP